MQALCTRTTPGSLKGTGPYTFNYHDLYEVQSVDQGSTRLDVTSADPFGFTPIILSDFCLLQVQCASCKLLMSDGWPPRATGIM